MSYGEKTNYVESVMVLRKISVSEVNESRSSLFGIGALIHSLTFMLYAHSVGFRGQTCAKPDACFYNLCVDGAECINTDEEKRFKCICDGVEGESQECFPNDLAFLMLSSVWSNSKLVLKK